jgi:hypothetical protein
MVASLKPLAMTPANVRAFATEADWRSYASGSSNRAARDVESSPL